MSYSSIVSPRKQLHTIKTNAAPKTADGYLTYQAAARCTHQAIRNGMNSISQVGSDSYSWLRLSIEGAEKEEATVAKASTVTVRQDIRDFLGYTYAFAKAAQDHQSAKRTFLSPQYASTTPSSSASAHDYFSASALLSQLEELTRTGMRNTSYYDPHALIKVLQALRDTLLPHLAEEEDRATVEFLQQCWTEDEICEVNKKVESYAVFTTDPSIGFIFLWTHLKKEERLWPELSSMVKSIFMPIWYMKHRRWWKFAPYKL